MKLTSVKEINSIMNRHNLRFNKGYGQNFLINEAIPRRIALECGAEKDSGILEIGPGIGTLTRELCLNYKKVVAVEIDTNLIPVLSETTADFNNLKIINADILKLDLKQLLNEEFDNMKLTVCANLPYYITTPIIMFLLESGVQIDYITVMIQKEVAARLCSKPGEQNYGAITASVMRYGTVEKLFNVSSGNFLPAPKVDSAVVRIKIDRTPNLKSENEIIISRCIRGAFAQRRKTLLNSLASEFTELSKSQLLCAIESCNFPCNIRGEQLGINEFTKLSKRIYVLISGKSDQ